jgi:murein DD-endopeptidase MepM/ murein hydrolase activator NlpD
VLVKHTDGTWSEYVGLESNIPVQLGQKLKAGDVIGKAGANAWSNSWMGSVGIHFAVVRLDENGERETVDIRYDDGSQAGFVPLPGSYYGAGGKATKADASQGGATKPAE